MSRCLVARSSNKLENGLKLLHVVADETLNRTMYNVIISIVMSNLCRFYIMAAILDFRALEREKMAPYFFLCLYHILTESGEFLLLPKNTRIFIS